jgi:hypothetical protein
VARGVGLVLVEERVEAVIIALREGIELMIVALRAADGRAQPDAAEGVDAIDDGLDAEFLGIDAALLVNH